jgi:hypothetical protein
LKQKKATAVLEHEDDIVATKKKPKRTKSETSFIFPVADIIKAARIESKI